MYSFKASKETKRKTHHLFFFPVFEGINQQFQEVPAGDFSGTGVCLISF